MPICLALKNAVTISPTGEARPCCSWQSRDGLPLNKINKSFNSWYEQMESSDDFLPHCKECEQDEADNNKSLRLYMNEVLSDAQGLDFWDFKINNTCNLACRSCDAVSSSSWAKIIKDNMSEEWHPHTISSFDVDTGWHKEIKDLYPQLYEAKNVKFTGGEPFLIPQVESILEFLVQEELSHVVNLQFITNGTQQIDHLIDLLNHFKSITIIISVDAIGDRFEYIRSGAEWEQVSNNILNIKEQVNSNVIITCLPSVLNKDHIHEVEGWCNDNNLIFNRASNLIRPEYLQVGALDDIELKKQLIKQMEILDRIHNTNYKEFIDENN